MEARGEGEYLGGGSSRNLSSVAKNAVRSGVYAWNEGAKAK